MTVRQSDRTRFIFPHSTHIPWLTVFISEERQIVERIKDFVKNENSPSIRYIMLRNKRTLNIDNYRDMVSRGKINPNDANMYINITVTSLKSAFYYPFLVWHNVLLDTYLSKLGFYHGYNIVSATGLKYVVNVLRYEKYSSIELVDLDNAVNNTNLRKIVFEVLGKKLISGEKELTKDEDDKIYRIYKSQRLFAGHDFDEVYTIIYDYYDKGNQSLAKEVARISMDYVDIFHPYRVCYETKTWKEIDCWKIKLE